MRRLLTPAQRDRSRGVATAVAGAFAACATAAVGFTSAVVANDSTAVQAEKALRAQQAQERARASAAAADASALSASYGAQVAWAAAHPVVVEQERPHRTVVDPEAVQQASAPGAAQVGGPVSSPKGRSTASSSGGSMTAGSSTRVRRPAPPAPVRAVAPIVPPVPSTAS